MALHTSTEGGQRLQNPDLREAAALGRAEIAGQDAEIDLRARHPAHDRLAQARGGVEVRIADVQDTIAVERPGQSGEADFDRAVADVETIRDAALPQPAKLEGQPHRDL